MSDLVPIADFTHPWEAHMLRGRLESEGIFAVVTGDGLEGPRNCGVQVQVVESDVEKALDVKRRCDAGQG